MRFKGLERITKHFSENEIDYSLCGGYELFDNTDAVISEQLLHNIEYVNSILKPVTKSKKTYRLIDHKIESFGFGNTSHIVKNNLEGYLHSGKLLQSLLSKIQGMGVTVLNHLKICNFELDGQLMQLTTNQELKLQSKKILLCTNAFTKQLVEDIDIKPARGQVILTSSISNLPWKGTFHSDEGFYYFRNLGDKVLLGGARNKAFEEETSTDISLTNVIQNELERYLKEVVLPWTNDYTIEYRWSGIMAMGSEKMPIVKELQPNVFCAVRMSGMGVALAPVVSQQIAEMMFD
jgi:glycine/D-amino acid oxidase-like deaminating enzyme